MKRALICGVTGQDGAYLAQFLLRKGYEVWGTSRDAQMATRDKLKALGIDEKVTMLSMVATDFHSVLLTLERSAPDEIYALAGQSSVGLSFDQPAETIESITLGTLNILEAIRMLGMRARLYHASSSECFGDLEGVPATESTPFRPRSPYAVAKASAHWLVVNYREAYGLFACNGVLFNHESPLRPARFVTRKITAGVRAIHAGRQKELVLGRLDISRDWGWAPEFVEAMWLMLQQPAASDYIVATGATFSLQEFVAHAFQEVGMDWRSHVRLDPTAGRPTDLAWSGGDASKARTMLGWQAECQMPELVVRMLAAEQV